MEKREGMQLTGVKYSSLVGMTYGEDFSIDIEKDRIVCARYFRPTECDYEDISNVAVTPEQWDRIEAAVYAILPVLKVSTPKKHGLLSFFSLIEAKPVDGPNEFSFSLTWQSPNGSGETVSYQCPSDRRFSTLVSILMETANPIGREIIYYDAPVINGLHVVNGSYGKKGYFSYQFTVDVSSQDKWNFFAYYEQGGEIRSFSSKFDAAKWDEFSRSLSISDLETLKDASYGSKTTIKIYYSDSSQRVVRPDKDTLDQIRTAFESFISACVTE